VLVRAHAARTSDRRRSASGLRGSTRLGGEGCCRHDEPPANAGWRARHERRDSGAEDDRGESPIADEPGSTARVAPARTRCSHLIHVPRVPQRGRGHDGARGPFVIKRSAMTSYLAERRDHAPECVERQQRSCGGSSSLLDCGIGYDHHGNRGPSPGLGIRTRLKWTFLPRPGETAARREAMNSTNHTDDDLGPHVPTVRCCSATTKQRTPSTPSKRRRPARKHGCAGGDGLAAARRHGRHCL
jgi:hypothetical protein